VSQIIAMLSRRILFNFAFAVDDHKGQQGHLLLQGLSSLQQRQYVWTWLTTTYVSTFCRTFALVEPLLSHKPQAQELRAKLFAGDREVL
jgi:hypothetical protein